MGLLAKDPTIWARWCEGFLQTYVDNCRKLYIYIYTDYSAYIYRHLQMEGAETQKCLHLVCIGKIDLKRIWKMNFSEMLACTGYYLENRLIDVTDCYTVIPLIFVMEKQCVANRSFQEQLSLTPWFPDRSLLLFQPPGSWRDMEDMIRHDTGKMEENDAPVDMVYFPIHRVLHIPGLTCVF